MAYNTALHLQLSQYFSGPEDYALSKDLDVALWLDSREYLGEAPLTDALDFVIVNCHLHDQFDQFRAAETRSCYSHVHMVELLRFYCQTKSPHLLSSSRVQRFGKSYLNLHSDQIDELVDWVQHTREKFDVEGRSVFDPMIQVVHSEKSHGMIY